MQSYSDSKVQSWLGWFFKGILILGFLILFARLAELQVIKGDYYKNLSDNNRVREVPILAPRGKVFARGGEVIIDNKQVKKTVIFSQDEGILKELATDETSADEILVEPQRFYPFGSAMAHITGFVGEVNEEEVGKVNPECLEKGSQILGSITGRSGLEQQYNCILRGIDGKELVEVDSFGNKLRVLGRTKPQEGQDVHTTINLKLQRKIPEIIAESEDLDDAESVAIIVTDTQGEVLALYSSPSFDPNIFVEDGNVKKVQKILTDNTLPMFNRVISGSFHPGSIFKIVTSIAALEEGAISQDYEYDDKGIISVNGFDFTNWYFTQFGSTEGLITLTRAIARSTDTFFYEIGALVGPEKLSQWSEKLGLGETTKLDLPAEAVGLVPNPKWKKAVKGERWFLGNTYHLSIGQGDLLTTPLQANQMVSVVASRGELCRPFINSAQGIDCKDLSINQDVLDTVLEGMIGACSSGGTAFPFFDFEPQVACKTGTAETFSDDSTHAWFSVFGPAKIPEIVVTVLAEKGGEGSKNAAPIARQIFDFWFNP